MIHNLNALVVPALPSEFRAGDEVAHIARILEGGGIRPITLNKPFADQVSIPTTLEYWGDMDRTTRHNMARYADEQRGLIAASNIVVIANALDESIVTDVGGEPVCRVPFAVGWVAISIIRTANEIYGQNSGRVVLSQDYPVLNTLLNLDSRANAVVRARARLRGVHSLQPVALQGNFERMIAMAKTPLTPEI